MNQKAQVLTSIAALVIVTLIVASNYYHLGTEAAAPTDVNVLERATKGCEYRLSAKCLARNEEPKVPSSGQHEVLARHEATEGCRRPTTQRVQRHEARSAECRTTPQGLSRHEEIFDFRVPVECEALDKA